MAPGPTRASREHVEQRLRGTAPGGDPLDAWIAGLTPEQTSALRQQLPTQFKRAAVLVPLVERPEGLSVLLTQRASHLKNHPGQISFPGGRVEPDDAGPWEAAVRETWEAGAEGDPGGANQCPQAWESEMLASEFRPPG